MSDRSINDLHSDLQTLCIKFLETCHAHGVNVFITQTYRSSEEQDVAYAKGRTTAGSIITNARGGQSAHNCTLADGTPAARAFDFAIKNDNGTVDWDASDLSWQKAIAIGERLGLVSGSKFLSIKDAPHMEMKDWKNIK